ncbi:DUF2480 family protein [Dokdonia ponticola]|uniref:DUF2480 family protein n=1 Tax=Dokdonia ponticola TaxID=2041041 RepID=A0ABV9I0V1_9FLAO
MEEIVNRVANSKLITFDLEDLYALGARMTLDISQWLEQGFILREKSFRESVSSHNWTTYQDAYVALYCSTDAIVPAWAYMLVATHLQGVAKKTITGSLETLETILYTEAISIVDVTPYQDRPIIVKGCSNKPVPENAYLLLIEKLHPVAKSLLFGEACSSVPLFKKKK